MWNPFFREPSSVLEASDGERQRAIEGLVEATTFRKGYYLLLTLSVIIVTCGLVVGNSPIVIGGMVLARMKPKRPNNSDEHRTMTAPPRH